MKKSILFILLAAVLALTAVGCGKKPNDTADPNTGSGIISENNSQNPVQQIFHPAASAAAGAYATIQVSSDIQFDDPSAWLGLCPAGKDYITELEADDADVIWFNADVRENDTDPHVFACDFSSVEDGTYALVITSSDDENVGYVIVQLEMTKKGDTLTFNYDNAKIKERPAH